VKKLGLSNSKNNIGAPLKMEHQTSHKINKKNNKNQRFLNHAKGFRKVRTKIFYIKKIGELCESLF
jgi:hypothetical protein